MHGRESPLGGQPSENPCEMTAGLGVAEEIRPSLQGGPRRLALQASPL